METTTVMFSFTNWMHSFCTTSSNGTMKTRRNLNMTQREQLHSMLLILIDKEISIR